MFLKERSFRSAQDGKAEERIVIFEKGAYVETVE